MKLITSLQNSLLKSFAALRNSPARKKTGTFLVEGAREISRACAAGFVVDTCLVCPGMFSELGKKLCAELQHTLGSERFIELDSKCFNSLVMREDVDGIAVVFKTKKRELSSLMLPAQPLILAVENLEKPGNLGAILRSADGAGVSAVLVLSSKPVDLYHPHIIRNSLGTVFSLPIAVCTNEELLTLGRKHNFAVYAACLTENAASYSEVDYTKGSCILVGSEAWGLSQFWQQHCSKQVYIPMHGTADSLNVAVASAVLIFEARRQRTVPPLR